MHQKDVGVIEASAAGVQAAKKSGFSVIIGVDRQGDGDVLKKNGADMVVKDLSEIVLGMTTEGSKGGRPPRPWTTSNRS